MTFFKCDSNIGFREDLFGLSIETKWIWIFILGIMSKKMSSEFSIDLAYISYHNNNLEISKIKKSLDELVERKLISYIPESYDSGVEKQLNYCTDEEILDSQTISEFLEETFQTDSPEKKRIDQNRSDQNRSKSIDVADFFKPIRHQEIIALWNKYFPEKLFRGFSLGSGKHSYNFEIANGFPELAELSNWEDLFKIAKESEFLTKANWFDLTWIINYDNAVNVLNNKYSQKFNLEHAKGSTSKVRVDLIMKVLSSGYSSLKEIPPDFGLNEFEISFIRDNGGLKQLGQQNQFSINQLISAAS